MVSQKCPNNKINFRHSSLSRLVKLVIAGSLLGAMTPVQAASWELNNGVQVDLDTQLAYAAQWRMEKQDANLLDLSKNGLLAINADDGNRSFDRGDMTQNRFSFATDLDVFIDNDSFSGGVFVRARGFYDGTYSGTSANQSPATCNQGLVSVGGDVAIGPLPGLEQINIIAAAGNCSDFSANEGINDYHKSRVELLDAFFYTNFELGDKSVSFRIGDQVVSWGESLALYGGISSAQGPLDVSKANVPGVELKDIFMPVGQVYIETDLSEAFSLGVYYQYDWDRSRIDSPGTYMSPVDIVGEGVQSLIIPFGGALLDAPVVRDQPEAGQWGITLRYLAEELNSTEFGFFILITMTPCPHSS